MDFVMRMPDLATVDATVTVVAWLKELGEQVKRGEPLLEVETDKAILPVESPVVGVLREITAATGAEVAMGQMIARLTVNEESLASTSPTSSIEPVSEPARPDPITAAAAPSKASSKTVSGPPSPAATPRVSLFARNRQALRWGRPRPRPRARGYRGRPGVQARVPQISLRADGHDPRIRGWSEVSVPGGRDARHDSSVPGAGRHRRRGVCRPRGERLHHLHFPWPWPCARQRADARGAALRAVRGQYGLLSRQRRLDARG